MILSKIPNFPSEFITVYFIEKKIDYHHYHREKRHTCRISHSILFEPASLQSFAGVQCEKMDPKPVV